MKICILQPRYPAAGGERACFEEILKLLDACTPEDDLIVLPEYSNAPGVSDAAELRRFCAQSTPCLLQKVKETAIRCHALVSVNGAMDDNGGLRNTTLLFDRSGSLLGRYEKCHPTIAETGADGFALDNGYGRHPVIIEAEGLRFGFLTCYDIYFGELLENIAFSRPDVILFPTYQRRETPEITELQTRLLAHKTNAFVARASLSMGADSPTGGNGMVCSPEGKTLACMGQNTGLMRCEIDPKQKRTWPDNPGLTWLKYRQPQAFRPAGSAVIAKEEDIPYPRICAHRGFNTAAPENTLPAFGAAIALGAEEFEFDVRVTSDRELVVCHDPTLDRTTDRTGKIIDLPLSEVRKADAGVKFAPAYAGTRIPLAEEVISKFAGLSVMNIHVNIDLDGAEFDDAFCRLTDMIRRYSCEEHAYIAGPVKVMAAARKFTPDLSRCCLEEHFNKTIVDNAIEYGCPRLQLFKPYFDDAMIRKAKAHGIRLNMFWSDDPEEAKAFIRQGIDTILTNDYLTIARAIR